MVRRAWCGVAFQGEAGLGVARLGGYDTNKRGLKMKKDELKQELEQIREQNGGMLRPVDVVAFAENPETNLHKCFTWDDTEAAHNYRLWEARTIIRVCVTTAPKDDLPPMRVFVSLKSDRKKPGGGYQAMVDVLSDEEKRRELLEQATEEFKYYETKYRQLSELTEVFAAMDDVRKSLKRRKTA